MRAIELSLPVGQLMMPNSPLAVRPGPYGPSRRQGADAGLPLHHFPLAEAAKAHAAVENSVVGKVLINVAY